MTDAERRAALEAIADEVRVCTRCRLHETRTKAVPGEGDPSTEVMFVGEGPGMNEDREGRPFVGRAGGLLVNLLGHIGWGREDVFITNIVKCRPPGNRDPEPDEIAACAPYLERQLQALDPSVVVTLGRLLDGPVHAGRPDLPGPRHDAHRRPGDRRAGRHGVRDVPPGRRAADARHRARELRGRGADPDRPDRGPRPPGRARRAARAAAAGAGRRQARPASRAEPERRRGASRPTPTTTRRTGAPLPTPQPASAATRPDTARSGPSGRPTQPLLTLTQETA